MPGSEAALWGGLMQVRCGTSWWSPDDAELAVSQGAKCHDSQHCQALFWLAPDANGIT